MNFQELNMLLINSTDRFGIFANKDFFNTYNITDEELKEIIINFLNDDEKKALFDLQHFKQISSEIKASIINSISNSKDMLDILRCNEISKSLNGHLADVIMKLEDNEKLDIMKDREFWNKHSIKNNDVKRIIESLEETSKMQVLRDQTLITEIFEMDISDVACMVSNFKDDNIKEQMINQYAFDGFEISIILSSLCNNNKIRLLLSIDMLDKSDICRTLNTLDVTDLLEFFQKNKDFLDERKIKLYEITKDFSEDKQMQLLETILSSKIGLEDKKKVLATLNPKVKSKFNIDKFPEELRGAFFLRYNVDENSLEVDTNVDVESYKGLDELIFIRPENLSEEQIEYCKKICKICPNLSVINRIYTDENSDYISSAEEFLKAEEWIDYVMRKIEPGFTNAQKIAIIDNAIGKKISYSPNCETETFVDEDAKRLWKIISTGYGTCAGVSNIERYMLRRVGIKSRIVGSDNHAFLKLENMEFQLADGSTVVGTTLLDPTWNLAHNRYGARPKNFCVSYEEIRKHDITRKGTDRMCHKVDEAMDATLNLDEDSLKMIFKSVNLTDKNGDFPISYFLEEATKIDEQYANDPEKNIERQLELIAKVCPEFYMCQNSTMSILKNISLNRPCLGLDRCVVNRVYNKNDTKKTPVIYIYAESPRIGKKFFVASIENKSFVELSRSRI